MENINEKFSPIRKGLLEFLVLKLISVESLYVADILKKLNVTEFATQEGTLYPLLSKMRRDKLLDYDWEESDVGPPRKYYRLTKKGEERLDETEKYWQTIISTIKNLDK